MTLDQPVSSRTKLVILIGASIGVAAVATVDYLVRWEISFFTFYAVPIFFVAWSGSRRTAILFTLMCALVSWAVNISSAPSFSLHIWRSTNRMFAFSFVAATAVALRTQREHFKSRIEVLERNQELEQEIIRISEREQRRIGQDLHDSVCQNLAAIDCAAGLLRKTLEASRHDGSRAADEIQHMLRETLLETRALARGIFPVQVEKEGLAVAVEELVSSVKRFHDVPVSFRIDGEICVRDPEVAMHLYRITQEALGNALKHADAQGIEIMLKQDARGLSLCIEDDGRGIETVNPQGMGLRTIRYRSQQIGADLAIGSGSQKGTRVQCLIPRE